MLRDEAGFLRISGIAERQERDLQHERASETGVNVIREFPFLEPLSLCERIHGFRKAIQFHCHLETRSSLRAELEPGRLRSQESLLECGREWKLSTAGIEDIAFDDRHRGYILTIQLQANALLPVDIPGSNQLEEPPPPEPVDEYLDPGLDVDSLQSRKLAIRNAAGFNLLAAQIAAYSPRPVVGFDPGLRPCGCRAE